MAIAPPPLPRNRHRRRRRWLLRALGGGHLWDDLTRSVQRAPQPRPLPAVVDPPRRARVSGAIHVHTTYSDGAGDVPAVIAAAERAGVEFVILADHDCVDALRDGWEGYHQGRLLIVGAELRSHGGYVLALRLPPWYQHRRAPARAVLDAVAAAGGTSFLALTGDPCLGWNKWRQPDVAGLEVLNLASLGRRRASLPTLFLFLLLQGLGRRAAAMSLVVGRPERELAVWDALLAEQRTAGLASVDAHSRVLMGPVALDVPSYEQCFRLLQTQLVLDEPLTGEAAPDKETVFRALCEGRSHLVFDGLAPGAQYHFWARNEAGLATAGEELPIREETTLRIECAPERTLHRLIFRGQVIGEAEGSRAEFVVREPGAYRVETSLYGLRLGRIRLRVRPWVFTNPIYLREG